MLRFVPPAGAPLEFTQILRAAKSAAFQNGKVGNLTGRLAGQLGVCNAFGTRSGRVALWLIFKALNRIRPDRTIVALPAYTCFTVPASVVRAGFTVCPVDIDPETLDFDFKQLERLSDTGLLCVVACNLFGLVNDLERIGAIAASKGAFVVDDAAQALGASRNGCCAGSRGDVGFFSFGRGKALPAMEGGLVVTNSEEISTAIRREAAVLPTASQAHSVRVLTQMVGFAAFLHPRLYWIPNSIPFLKLGSTEFAPDFPISGMSELSGVLISQLMSKLSEMNAGRVRNATRVAEGMKAHPGFFVPRPICGSKPIYTRFAIVASHKRTRDRAVARLRAEGIGATPSFPSAICDIPGLECFAGSQFRHCPGAESLADRVLTLPTHCYVGQQDIDRMIEVLGEKV